MQIQLSGEPVFSSYWQGGYEGADHINRSGIPLSMNHSNHHASLAHYDYSLLRQFGIRTIRESTGWRLIEKEGQFDFSSLELRARAARKHGLQVIWTLCHYGWPDDIDVYSTSFIERFERFCTHVVKYLEQFSSKNSISVYAPINEISYWSWACVQNPHICTKQGDDDGTELKRQLVRATLAGCSAIWRINPSARILHCDPLIHVIASPSRPDLTEYAYSYRQSQFSAWDMICGMAEPELGGAPRFLDLIGANYYHSNQWQLECPEKWQAGNQLWWHLDHSSRLPLWELLAEVHERYRRPLLLSETSHVGSGRGAWIKDIAHQAVLAHQAGVDLRGICIYPILDRPDWEETHRWHKSGLWEVASGQADEKRDPRSLIEPYATALRDAQRITDLFLHCKSKTLLTSSGGTMTTIIVFSHLRWNFVYQRPQHLLSRLAENYKIVFIEEPLFHEQDSFFEASTPFPNLTVLKPYTPISEQGFHDAQLPYLIRLLQQLPALEEEHVAWFYTPMALPLLQELQPAAVIYDCMDELSAFKNSPRQMLQRENALLRAADLVFTGGPSLYRLKREQHSNVHCFPSSVDTIHFEQALDRSNTHPAHEDIPGPRLGFYGVIDERVDMDLIDALAQAHPRWQIVLVGPIAKIDAATLPRRHNIHYLGQQPYKALPHLLAGWNVCLLPFALNEATRFISPTKTLEYMAAGLPIISTPVMDVVELYGDVVSVAETPREFIKACEEALLTTPEENKGKIGKMKELISATSWDSTAEKMHELIQRTIAQRDEQSAVARDTRTSHIQRGTQPPVIENKRCIIIGAGPTGLSAAFHLGEDALLLDRNPAVGGWCRSIEDKGFTFDHAGHIMFSNDPYVHQLYKILLRDNVHWQNREAWVYSKGVHTRYPFQGALHGLPPSVIKECIIGAIDSRYGASRKPVLKSVAEAAPSIDGAAAVLADCCADGSVPETRDAGRACLTEAVAEKSGEENFEDFIYRMWGAGIAKHFAIPYNRKLWTVPLTEMETSWLGGRVPLPDLDEIIEGALQPVSKPMGPNARFGYPLRGGFQAMMSGFLPHIKGTIELDADVEHISPDQHLILLRDGRRYHYEHLISTMPLPELVRAIGGEAPAVVRQAASGLRHVSVRCVNLGVGRENLSDKHWIYYPEDTIFHRIFLQGNASPGCNPPGGFGLTCEITYSPAKPLPVDGQNLIDRCVQDCTKVGLMNRDDKLITANLVDMPYAYVIYDHARKRNVEIIRKWLSERDIILSGRYSEWEYYNSDHAFLAGKRAAEMVENLRPVERAYLAE